MIFDQVFESVLTAFNSSGVEYMVVGGYAVNFHGFIRNTANLDIWVSTHPNNQMKICSALKLLEYNDEAISKVSCLNFEKTFLFHVGEVPNEVEVFNFITGVNFEEAFQNKVELAFGKDLAIYFISLHDLLKSKMLTGRTKDKLDVEELQKIEKLK